MDIFDLGLTLEELKKSDNIVELLPDDVLSYIGDLVVKGYKIDEDSRAEWKETCDKATALAQPKIEIKNTPWPNASNVKYPLIAKACIAYASRTRPEIIQNDRIVKPSLTGNDPQQKLWFRGHRVCTYMSYQLLKESKDWVETLDRLLQILPVVGTVFKKTYYSDIEKRIISELCVPDKIVVNYNTVSLDTARRITHILDMYANDVIERQRMGMYSEKVDPDLLRPDMESKDDYDFKINLLEQHCWLDLDNDGYKEPYIVTVHELSRKVLRIVNRFKKVTRNKDKEVLKITAIEYFTDFHFIRSSDGGFYSMGFGSYLLPLNHAINTTFNQLIDSGTLNNMQGGLLGRSLRIKNGEFKYKMGEWQVVDSATGTDLKANVFPMPTKEPSQVLYSLLELLLKIGDDLSSTTDTLKGQQPAQNVASGTISTLVDQGLKVFIAINERFCRSMEQEYRKIYDLNFYTLDNKHYQEVLQDQRADVKTDFELETLNIVPVADPSMSSASQRLSKATILQQLSTVDKHQADLFMLESLEFDASQIQLLCPQPDPNAATKSPQYQESMAKIRQMEADSMYKSAQTRLDAEQMQIKFAQLALQKQELEAKLAEASSRIVKMGKDSAHGDAKVAIAASKMQSTELLKGAQFVHQQDKDAGNAMLEASKNKLEEHKLMVEMARTEKENNSNE